MTIVAPPNDENRYIKIATTITRLKRVWMAHPDMQLDYIVNQPFAEADVVLSDEEFIKAIEEYWKDDEV